MSTEYVQPPEKYSRQRLNALYRAIPMKDTTFRLLRKYFAAMSVLYGVIPLRKAKEIIQSQNPNLVTDEAFLAFAEIAAHEREEYTIMGDDEIYLDQRKPQPLDRKIIHLSLFGTASCDEDAADSDPNDVFPLTAITMRQRGKPYYIPPKKEFLTYETILNVLNPAAKAALLDFLQKRCGMSEWEAFFAMIDLVRHIQIGLPCTNQIVPDLDAIGIRFQTEHDVGQFMKIYQLFCNGMRMMCNRGYTPDELSQIQPPSDMPPKIVFGPGAVQQFQSGQLNPDIVRSALLNADIPEETRASLLDALDNAQASTKNPAAKVGRNDPCPCGSGKKYKKCCGR